MRLDGKPEWEADARRHGSHAAMFAAIGLLFVLLAFLLRSLVPQGEPIEWLVFLGLILWAWAIFGFVEILILTLAVRAGYRGLKSIPTRPAGRAEGVIYSAFLLTAIDLLLFLYLCLWFWDELSEVMKW